MIANSSIYGESLLSFSEQLQNFEYFDMSPMINDNYTILPTSGYDGTQANSNVVKSEVPYGYYLGIFQNDESSIINAQGNLVNYQKYFLWCEETLVPGKFIKWSNTTWRIVISSEWPFYAGFTQYEIERVVGSDGQGTVSSGFSDGGDKFQ